MGQQFQKKHYDGDKIFPKGEYDYIFDVQSDDGLTKRLPYNEGDNVYQAAENFLNREQMNIIYKEQIVEFIRKNTKGKGAPLPKPQEKKANPTANLSPLREKHFYTKMNMDGLHKKVLEINEKLKEEKNENIILESELKYLNGLIVKLRDPKIYNYVKEFATYEIDILKKLLTWPSEHCIPVFDLFRVFFTHHASGKLFSGLDSGLCLTVPLIGKLGGGPKVLWKLYGKILSNMFCHDVTPLGVVKATDIIVDSMAKLDRKDEVVISLLSNFLMNFSSIIDCV